MKDYSDVQILLNIDAFDRTYRYADRDGTFFTFSVSNAGRLVVEDDLVQYRGTIINAGEIRQALSVDGSAPSVGNIQVTLNNVDSLEQTNEKIALESATATLLYVRGQFYDDIIGSLTGKINNISYDATTITFEIGDDQQSIFKKVPELVLQEDTFQTRLVLFNPDIVSSRNMRMRHVAFGRTKIERTAVKYIRHAALAENSRPDDYWKGARIDVVDAEGEHGDPADPKFCIGEFAVVCNSSDNQVRLPTAVDRYFAYAFTDESWEPNVFGNTYIDGLFAGSKRSRGFLTCVPESSLRDGHRFCIGDGTNQIWFAYDCTGTYTPPSWMTEIVITGMSAQAVAAATAAAIAGVSELQVLALNPATTVYVILENKVDGPFNVPITEVVVAGSASLNPVGMRGGANTPFEMKEIPNNTMQNTAKAGNNLVQNGTFDSATGWTLGTNWSIGSGKASKAAGTNTQEMSQALGEWLDADGTYIVTVTVASLSGTNPGVRISFGFGGSNPIITVTENGSYKLELQNVDGTSICFRAKENDNVFDLDNVQVTTKDKITLQIIRRGVPENADSVGRPFPIVYGRVSNLWAVWAISSKSTRQNSMSAGDDVYVIAGHPIFDRDPSQVLVYYGLDENWKGVSLRPGLIDYIPNPLPRSINEIERWNESGFDMRSGDASKDVCPLHKLVQITTNQGQVVTAVKLRGDEYTGWIYDNQGNDVTDGSSPGINGQPQFAIRYGLGNSKVYCSFAGHYDETGEITGVAGGLIEHPIDIIKHFLLQYTNINWDRSKIDEQSFADAKALLPNWRFGMSITDQADGAEILTRLTTQCCASWFWRAGKFCVKVIDLEGRNPSRTLDSRRDFIGKLTFRRTPSTEIYNDFVIKYAFNHVTEKFDRVIQRNKSNDQLCRKSFSLYGVVRSYEEIELPDVDDSYTANAYADRLVALKALPRLTLEGGLRLSEWTAGLEPGEVVDLTLWNDRRQEESTGKWVAVEVGSNRTTLGVQLLELLV